MSNLLLPGDPDFDKPIVMGDAYRADPNKDLYSQVLPPGVKRTELEKQRVEDPGAFKYAASAVAHAPDPWYKMAQMSGVDNMMSQPMWFSPLHTPQNWQIASKRREVYQWNRFWYENEPKVAAAIDFYCFAPETQILMANGVQKSISSIEPGDLVRSHDGSTNKVIRTFNRETSEQILVINVSGVSGELLKVTKGHELLTQRDGEIQFVQAQFLGKGDCLLTPIDCVSKDENCKSPDYKEGKYLFRKIRSIKEQDYTGNVYDLEIENVHSYVANRISCHNSRFPMNGFKLECPDRKILSFFEHHVVKKLRLNERFKEISSEYYTLGDVFIHTDIECPICFPADTMVTTENGHKPIQFVQVGENVLCLNGDYHQVERTVSRKYAGNMIDFKISHLPNLICTELHPIYAVKGFYYEYGGRKMVSKKLTNFDNIQKVEAKNLDTGDYVVVPIHDKHDSYDQIVFDQSEYYLKNKSSRPSFTLDVDHDLAKLFAWYVGEGSTDSNRTVTFSLNGLEEHDIADWIIETCERLFGISFSKGNHYKSSQLNVSGYNRALSAWMDELCGHGSANKHVPFFIFHSSNEIKNTFINNLQFADGHARKERKEKSITTISRTLAYDIVRLLHGVGQSPFVTETSDRTDANGIHHRHAYCVCWTPDKTKEGKGSVRTEKYQFYRILDIRRFTDETTVYNITVENQHNYVAGGLYVKNCGGTAIDPDTEEPCDHEGGKFSRVFVMNPDWIEVQRSPLTDEPLIVMIPDEELQQIVHKRQPKAIYDRIPEHLKPLIMAKAPIPLSNRTISHLRHMPVPYGTYGTSIIRRLFTTLAYKTKIMTANWIVAERLILPVRVVKIGSDDRPASTTDIADVQQQLAQTANDPNLTIVTHHNFDYEWYGCIVDEEGDDISTEKQGIYVITEEGPKRFNDLNVYTKIANLTSNGELSYDQYTRKVHFKYDKSNSSGEIYEIGNQYWNLKTTPNHRHYLSDGTVKRSDELRKGDELLLPKQWKWEGHIPDFIPYYKCKDLEHLSLEEFCQFIGFFVSEGSTTYDKNAKVQEDKKIRSLTIYQNLASPFYEDMKNICTKVSSTMWINIDRRREKETHGFCISNCRIAQYLGKECGYHALDKKLPNWILGLPVKYLKIVLKALMDGDGGRYNTKQSYSTISMQLKDQMLELLIKVRKGAYVKYENPGKTNKHGCYRIRWSTLDEPVKFKLQNIIRRNYEGNMWCLEMPHKNFFILVNGHLILTGNTSGKVLQITQEMEHIDKELLDGLMLNQALLNGEAPGYMCHDEKTEVLTDSGFKKYENVYTEDKIACYDVYTNGINYEVPLDKYEYDYDGELIHFENKRMDIKVTPNHKMLISRDKKQWDTVKAEQVKHGMYFRGIPDYAESSIQYPVITINNELVVEVGDNLLELNNFIKLAGYYLSEGTISNTKSSHSLRVYQSKKKKLSYASITKTFDDLEYNTHTYNYRNDEYQFVITSKELVEFMLEHFGHGSCNKLIPDWVKNLPNKYLEKLIASMCEGDGHRRDTKIPSWLYTSVSEKLIDDLQEIAFKCGYSTRKYNEDPQGWGKQKIFRLHISKGKASNGSFPFVKKQHISRASYKGKVWCFLTSTGFFVTRRNGKIAIQGNSAQVGVETLIRRIEAWRSSLAEWCEENIFKPVAEMQGFVDEEKSEEVGETVFLYPTIKWNDLELKDNTQYHQMLMQLHDKQVISSQTLLDEIGLKYDQEVKRMRYEQAQLGPAGAALGQGQGMGGGMDMGGGMGGMPGGAASPEQGGMGMGDMGGGMGGGMGDMGGGMGGGAGGGLGMAAGAGGKITKKGKGGEKEQEAIPMMPIKLTKIEQDMAVMLEELANNMGFNAAEFKMQFPVENPKGGKSFTMDFALPSLKMDVECLHPKTFLMTPDGMKIPQDIDIGSYLYDRNGNSTQVTNKFCQNYNGTVCEIQARGIIPFTITDTHKLLVSRPNKTRIRRTEPTITRTREYIEPSLSEFIEAKEIEPGDYVLFPKNANIESKDTISFNKLNKSAKTTAKMLPNDIRLDKDFGRFLGFYTSEGCASKSGSMWLCFGEHEKEYLDEAEILLSELFNLNVNGRYTDNGSTRMSFCSVVLAKFLISNVGQRAPNKKVPDFMFYAPDECKEAYLRAMCDGDGCFRDGDCDHLRIQTSSDQLVLGIQKLAATLGVWAPIAKSRSKGTYSIRGRTGEQNILWDVAVNFNPKKKVYREDENYFYIRVRSIVHEEYNGSVYNFTTEDHTYNIHNIVSKNCDGEVWHSSEEQTGNDSERDYLLAQRGWTILRFDDKSIEDSPQQVQATIDSYIKKLLGAGQKQASQNGKDTHGHATYFVGIDGQLKDFKSDGNKYYKYLNRVYSSRIPIFTGQRFN